MQIACTSRVGQFSSPHAVVPIAGAASAPADDISIWRRDNIVHLAVRDEGRAVHTQCPDSEVRHTLQHARRELRNRKDTSKSMILVPLLNPKFAIGLAAYLRVRGARCLSACFADHAPVKPRQRWSVRGQACGDSLTVTLLMALPRQTKSEPRQPATHSAGSARSRTRACSG